jgi:hypothetical protein
LINGRRKELLGLAVKENVTLTPIRHDEEANEDVEEDNTEDVDLHPIPTEVLIEEEEEDNASNQRTVAFVPTARNIKYVWRQIHSHDLTFLLENIFQDSPYPRLRVPQDNLGTDLSIG